MLFSWLLVKASHWLMREFQAFLQVQYGPDWASLLVESH
jgi:hypothetical protein